MLDYHKVPYHVVEVGPRTKEELKVFTTYNMASARLTLPRLWSNLIG